MISIPNRHLLVCLVLAAAISSADTSRGQLINVNFAGANTANEPPASLSGPAGGLDTTWNQVVGFGGSSGALLDSTGATTTVSISNNYGLTADDAATTLPILQGSVANFGKGADATVTISGLAAGGLYDVWLVSLRNQGFGGDGTEQYYGNWLTSNATSSASSQVLDAVNSTINTSTFVAGYNYVLFEDVVATAGGQIVFTADAAEAGEVSALGNRLGLNGLQIQVAPPLIAGPVNNAMSTVTATPAAVIANGVTASTVKVTLRDAAGVRVPNKQVTLANTGGLTPPAALTTNAQGEANFAVSSSTVGTVVFTATVVADSLTLTDTASVEFTDPGAPVAFNVNFHDGSPATGLLGVVGGLAETWNQGTTSVNNLTDATGTVTSSVNVTGLPDSGYPVDAALNVFDANRTFFDKGQDTTFSITGLVPDTAYDLYIYALSHNNASWGNSIDTERAAGDFVTTNTVQGNGQSQWLDNAKAGTNGDHFVVNGNVETGATGAGTIGSLRYLAVNDGSFPEYNYTSLLTDPANTASAFRTRSDVKVWWRDGGGNLGGTVRKDDLGPPFKGADNSLMGPEYAFGQVLGDFYPANDVLLIKCAWGGRDLAQQFRPPSAVARVPGTQVGPFFSAIINDARDVLGNLGSQFPEWSGKGYQIVGFAWHQGFNDRVNTAFSNEYKNNLPDFISDIRKVFNKPNLPFVIGSTGMDIGSREDPPYTGYSAVEKAQLWVAGVTKPAGVRSSDTRPFWRAPAQSPATSGQGFHWNWNAESYFLVGKTLGADMVNLLTP